MNGVISGLEVVLSTVTCMPPQESSCGDVSVLVDPTGIRNPPHRDHEQQASRSTGEMLRGKLRGVVALLGIQK